MKVKDLIALLSKYDPDVDVITANDGEDFQDEQLTEMFLTTYKGSIDYKGDYHKFQGLHSKDNFRDYIRNPISIGDKVTCLYLVLNQTDNYHRDLGKFNIKEDVEHAC